MEKFTQLTGIAAPMPMANINTDAITPMAAGRSTATDLGKMLFANWRYHVDGREIEDFILNREPFRAAELIVAGENFGCGSSRERAVWALMRFGIRCVIAPSFGEIFRENAYQNGLLPIALAAADCAELTAMLERADEPIVHCDLERCELSGPQGFRRTFSVPAERRAALLEGLDEIEVILRMQDDIDRFQQEDRGRRPWIWLDRVDRA